MITMEDIKAQLIKRLDIVEDCINNKRRVIDDKKWIKQDIKVKKMFDELEKQENEKV